MSTAVTTKLERRIARLLDAGANRMPLTPGRAMCGAVIALAFLVPIAGVRAEQTLRAIPAISLPKPTVELGVTPDAVPAREAAAPKKTPRGVTQIAQAQIAQVQVSQAPPLDQATPTGSLSGVVADPTGAVVAGATVGLQVSPDAGGAPVYYSTVSGPTGQWSFPSLPPGMYTLEVQVRGFRAFNKAGTVTAGINKQANVNLMVGRASESVTVTAERSSAAAGLSSSQPVVQASSKPIRVSSGVEPAKLIRHPAPVFPQSARDQGIQGSVTVEAIIDKAGFIANAKLVSSVAPPDMIQAALDAINQWQYKPALLNGEPVDILTEITVNFTLQ